MSDIQAGRNEVVKELKRVITNATGLKLRNDIKNTEELKLAVSMLQAALTLIERVK
jgi:hypothetical protein